MAIPTVTEVEEFKEDLDDAEALVNGFGQVVTRTGGTKDSYSLLVSRIAHGDITAYSALATYTDITDWVTESGIVYRPDPAQLPIGPESFDSDKWFTAQGYTQADGIVAPVETYAAALALPTSLPLGAIVPIYGDGIAGNFVVTTGAIPDSSTGVLLSNATWNAAGKHLARVNFMDSVDEFTSISPDVIDVNYSNPFRNYEDYSPVSSEFFAIWGQSLAEGGVGGDSVTGVGTPAYPNNLYMYDGGPVGIGSEILVQTPVALYDTGRVTIASSWMNEITADVIAGASDNIVFCGGQAWGGKAYSDLKKGGSSGVYEKILSQLAGAESLFANIEAKALAGIHGEQDGINNNTSYAANLKELYDDINVDWKAATGQSANIPLFVCQTSTAGAYGFNGGIAETTFPTPIQQLSAHVTYAGQVILVCPKYFLDYYDHSHITNGGQRLLGEYYSKAYRTVRDGGSWSPLRPSSFSILTNTVTITFTGNVGQLVFDTTLVNSIANSGFSYTDDSSRTISSVAISGTNQVVITLSGAVGTNAIVAYAYHNGAGGAANQAAGNGDRGNLRDSETELSVYDSSNLYNWCVTFREAIN